MPQQRLVISTDNKTHESTVVTLSVAAEKELKKTIDQAKADGGQITAVDLKKP